jgi:hypothetical protein
MANGVLKMVCSVAALFSLEPVSAHEVLFQQYDLKLWSHDDRILSFAAALVPALLATTALWVLSMPLRVLYRVIAR